MLFREKLHHELTTRRDELFDVLATQNDLVSRYVETLTLVSSMPVAEVIGTIGSLPGAVPDAREMAAAKGIVAEFPREFAHHEAARAWAGEVLDGRVTFGVDGSQILLEKETDLPIGGVQVGWFENPHSAGREYEKNVDFVLLSPADLMLGTAEPFDPATRVAERRFLGEVARMRAFLDRQRGWQDRGERMPLGFFDGTLLVSISLPRTALQTTFVRAMVELVRHSAETRVPFVGFVDRSFSRDLLAMLSHFDRRLPDANGMLFDALLVSASAAGHAPILAKWGDRTVFLGIRRRGLDDHIDPLGGGPLVGCVYLKTSGDAAPARADIPAWCAGEGLVNEIADVIRAECIVGVGYPYPLEAADHAAVISAGDRTVFLNALQEITTREKLNIRIARKDLSKARRR